MILTCGKRMKAEQRLDSSGWSTTCGGDGRKPAFFEAEELGPQGALVSSKARPNRKNGNQDSPAQLTQALRLLLEQTPVIPSVRSPEHVTQAARAHGKIVYLLCGDPESLPHMSAIINNEGKTPIVNVDLVQGLSRDASAVTYLAHNGIRGIISIHPEPLRTARTLEMYTIERTFLLDTAALQTALRSIDRVQQDAVEVLPAVVAPHLIHQLSHIRPDMPVIAGGLITTFREIVDLRREGVISVSVSNPAFWLRGPESLNRVIPITDGLSTST